MVRALLPVGTSRQAQGPGLEQRGQSGQDRMQSNPATCPRLLLCPEHPALCQDSVRTPRAPETWGRPLQGSGRTPKATSLCIVSTLARSCSNQAQLRTKKGTRQDPACVYLWRWQGWAPVTFEESTRKGQPLAAPPRKVLLCRAGRAAQGCVCRLARASGLSPEAHAQRPPHLGPPGLFTGDEPGVWPRVRPSPPRAEGRLGSGTQVP